jgi:7,8-dihydropterin-6-yl-methyl-4-(beta-D-ribofuranosyl)aminobenzene 5'-phosphate synthase
MQPTLQSDWGFACLVSGPEKTVLFDTGSNPDILLSNMRALSIDPQHVDAVVLSHAHQDHTGGLFAILARKSDIGVYCPASFSEGFTDRVREVGATLIPVRAASTICPGLTVTAPMGSSPEEIGLVIDSAEGPVLLTGCAHPGVATMAQTAATLGHGSLYAVLGGFHLSSRSAAEVSAIIEDLKRLGVRRCGPAHCTGEAATAQMSRAFGNGFIAMGVGAVVEF